MFFASRHLSVCKYRESQNKPKMAYSRDAFTKDFKEIRETGERKERDWRKKGERHERDRSADKEIGNLYACHLDSSKLILENRKILIEL